MLNVRTTLSPDCAMPDTLGHLRKFMGYTVLLSPNETEVDNRKLQGFMDMMKVEAERCSRR